MPTRFSLLSDVLGTSSGWSGRSIGWLLYSHTSLLCTQNGDVGATPGFNGDHAKALASITAKTLVMPAERDLYFPVADEQYEVSKMPKAELRVIPGVWGHFAGGGANADDTQFIDNAVKELLKVGNGEEDKDSSRFASLSVSA